VRHVCGVDEIHLSEQGKGRKRKKRKDTTVHQDVLFREKEKRGY
jgi:hypothetical protein